MICQYTQCKLGGNVEKESAEKIGNKYYHKECYIKQQVKAKVKTILIVNPKISHKDLNITLKKAIDEIGYDPRYVEFVTEAFKNKINTAYNLLYHLKFESNFKEYSAKKKNESSSLINHEIKIMEIDDEGQEFYVKPSIPKRLQIY